MPFCNCHQQLPPTVPVPALGGHSPEQAQLSNAQTQTQTKASQRNKPRSLPAPVLLTAPRYNCLLGGKSCLRFPLSLCDTAQECQGYRQSIPENGDRDSKDTGAASLLCVCSGEIPWAASAQHPACTLHFCHSRNEKATLAPPGSCEDEGNSQLTREEGRGLQEGLAQEVLGKTNKPKIPEKPQTSNHNPTRASPALSEFTSRCPNNEIHECWQRCQPSPCSCCPLLNTQLCQDRNPKPS